MTTLVATCARGTEDLVAAELRGLGFGGVRRQGGAVHFEAGDGGPLVAGMRACLHLRLALRVLWPLATFAIRDADGLYEGAAAVPWEDHLTARSTFAIVATTGAAPPLAHGPYLGQKVKDAVVDRLRARHGARPDVDRDDPAVRLYVHVGADGQATVGLDVGGDSLHLRGYRVAQTAAPLRETLAAAVVAATGWSAERPLVDPMCGSGTIAIEAALRACRIAPGLAVPGRRFGFERWPAHGEAERAAWRALVAEAEATALARAPVAIIGADRDAEAVAIARRNAAAAGPAVAASIEWSVADARALPPTDPPGAIVANAPYGQRLGGGGAGLEGFLRALGAHLRTLDRHTAFLLLGGPEAVRALGMRPTWERRLMNGPLPVTLARYELGRSGRRSS